MLLNCWDFKFFIIMFGLVKVKKYDWKDSNLVLFGFDIEKNVRS